MNRKRLLEDNQNTSRCLSKLGFYILPHTLRLVCTVNVSVSQQEFCMRKFQVLKSLSEIFEEWPSINHRFSFLEDFLQILQNMKMLIKILLWSQKFWQCKLARYMIKSDHDDSTKWTWAWHELNTCPFNRQALSSNADYKPRRADTSCWQRSRYVNWCHQVALAPKISKLPL